MQKILFLMIIGLFSTAILANPNDNGPYACSNFNSEQLLQLVRDGVFVFDENQNFEGNKFGAKPIVGGATCQGDITSDFFELPSNLIETLNEVRRNCGKAPVSPEVVVEVSSVEAEALSEGVTWLEGCEVLEGGLTASEKNSAKTCLNSIKTTILRGSRNRQATVFTNMFARLNPAERRFAAMIFTSVGESEVLAKLTGNKEEYISIMKVLDNRKKYARGRGISGASALGAALQSYQFSMYNTGERRWREVIIDKNMRTDSSISKAIDAYTAFESAEYQPDRYDDQIYHYYSTILDQGWRGLRPPRWRVGSREVNFSIDGVAIDGKSNHRMRGRRFTYKHRFYRNIAWTYSEPSFNR